MANKKITELPSGSIPTDLDIIPIVDYETLTTTGVRASYLSAYVTGSIAKMNLNSLTASNVTSTAVTASQLTVTSNAYMTGSVRIDGPIYGYTSLSLLLTGNYVLTNADSGKIVVINSSISSYLTLPNGLSGGYGISMMQAGVGTIIIGSGSGVSVKHRQSHTQTAGIYAVASINYLSGSTFIFAGDTQA